MGKSLPIGSPLATDGQTRSDDRRSARLPLAGGLLRLMSLLPVLLLSFGCGSERARSLEEAAAATKRAIDADCLDFLETEKLPGLSIAVLKGNEVFFAAGYGLKDVAGRQPVTTRTLFPIGSVEKQFTAAAILRLAERGRLQLEDPITRYLPRLDTGGERITIADMLNQVSGLQESGTRSSLQSSGEPSGSADKQWAPIPDQAVGDGFNAAEDIGSLAGQPLYFHPRDRFSYSQPNYDLLCYVIALLSGETYYSNIGRLARSAGLERFRPSWTPRPSSDETDVAQGYQSTGGGWELVWEPNLGSAWTTAVELAHWGRALESGRVVSRESYAWMTQPARLNSGASWPYGFGLVLLPFQGRPKVMHTGRVLGFYAVLARYPDEDLTIAIMTNRGGASSIAYTLEPRIARVVLGLEEPKALDLPLASTDALRFLGSYDAGAFSFEAVQEGERVAMIMRLGGEGDGEVFDRRTLRYQGDGVFIADGAPEWRKVRFAPGSGPSREVAIGAFAEAVRRNR